MDPIRLTGLDGQNPLAFFAALGLLRVLEDHARSVNSPSPRLCFEEEGAPTAVLLTEHSYDEVCELVLVDAKGDLGAAALALAYDDEGRRVDAGARDAIRDLKPPPTVARAFLADVAVADRRSADLAAAMFTEIVRDKTKGNCKPTAFHFTAGQQEFLEMAHRLRTSLTKEHLDDALVGPWQGTPTLPSLSWDATVSRLYALRASNPSKNKRGSVPGANWLAVVGLTFFPVAVERRRLATAGVTGGWKDARFRWPLWIAPTTAATARGLLRANATSLSGAQRAALGISIVFESAIVREDYATFAPPAVVLPGACPS